MSPRGLFVALFMGIQTVPVMAADARPQITTLSDEELSRVRGGFSLEGLDLSFGAEVRTYLDGELVLQTNFKWNREGISRSEFVSDAVSQPDAAQLAAGMLNGRGIAFSFSGQRVYLANHGQTALIHRTDGAIQNILMNTASNVSARQELDASFELNNASSFLTLVRDVRLGDALNSAIATSVPRM